MDTARNYNLRRRPVPPVTWVRAGVEVLAEPLPDGRYHITINAPSDIDLHDVTFTGAADAHAGALALCG